MEASYSHSGGELRPTSGTGTGAVNSDPPCLHDAGAAPMPIGLTADDLQCPICVDTIHDAFVTTCGHTFCYQCITTHLKHRRNCPSCGNYLTTDHIYPNFLLSKVLVKAAATQAAETSSSLADLVQQALVGTGKKLHIADLDEVIGLLKGKRDQLARHEATSSLQLLLLFLKEARQHKAHELEVLRCQLGVLERDLSSVTKKARQASPLSQSDQQQQQPDPHRLQLPAPVHAHPDERGRAGQASQQQQWQLAQQQEQQHSFIAQQLVQQGFMAQPQNVSSPAQAEQHHMHQQHDHIQQSNIQLQHQQQHCHIQQNIQQQQQPQHYHTHQHQHQQPVGRQEQHARAGADSLQGVCVKQEPHEDAGAGSSATHAQGCTPRVKHKPQEDGGAGSSAAFAQGCAPRVKQEPGTSAHAHAGGGAHANAGSTHTHAAAAARPAPRSTPPPNALSTTTAAAAPTTAGASSAGPSVAPSDHAHHQAHAGSGSNASLADRSAAAVLSASAAVPVHPGRHSMAAGEGPSHPIPTSAMDIADLAREMHGLNEEEDGTSLARASSEELVSLRAAKKRRIMTQFEELQHCYLQLRAPCSQQLPQYQQPRLPVTQHPQFSQHDPNQQQQQQQHQQPQQQQHVHEGQQQKAQGRTGGGGAPSGGMEAGKAGEGQQLMGVHAQHGLMHQKLRALKGASGDPAASTGDAKGSAYHRTDSSTNLLQFSEVLSTVTQHSRMAVQAEVPYAACGGWLRSGQCSNLGVASYPQPSTAILDMEFDLEEELLATCAGQRVFLWDYEDMLSTTPDSLEPVSELCCRLKLASVSFSNHQRSLLAAGDCDGRVYLWAVNTRQVVGSYAAHNKRVWALDFAPSGVGSNASGGGGRHLLASGSDDHLLKVWSPKEEQRPVAVMDTGANVCSVRFNPWNEHQVAVGSAAHTALVYDLRMLRDSSSSGSHKNPIGGAPGAASGNAPCAAPVALFAGHRKAVAYVRWAAEHELLCASTDSMLRLWDLRAAAAPEAGDGQGVEPLHAYSGHTNERNFVGLSHSGNYIATGSETGEVFIYLKHITAPSIRQRLSSNYKPGIQATYPPPQHQQAQQPVPFISAVSWRQKSQTLMAANSQGHLWTLALQQ